MKKIITILSIILLLANCNPKEEIAPENPCENAHAISAAFQIQEDWDDTDYGAGQWEYYDTDTVCTYRIKLTANEKNALSYKWKIGTDTTIFTQQSFTITFNGHWIADLAPKNIPVTLIVNKIPNKNCFPNDDGIDTFTRVIHFVSVITGTLVKGHFFGCWDGNIADTSTIYITTDTIKKSLYAYNLSPKFNTTTHGYGDYTYEKTATGYREIICSVNGGAYNYNTIRLNYDNSVNIVGHDFLNNKVHHFIGTKIQ